MILDADLSQIELRVAAHLSNDAVMIKEIINGIDMHAATCQDLMEMEVTKSNRNAAKGFNFRAIFANPETSWYGYYMDTKMPDFTQDKWKSIVKGYFDKYNGLAKWHEEIIQEVFEVGEYRGPTGRYWKFSKDIVKGVRTYSPNKIRNYMVQGTAGDIIKLCMLVINQRRLKEGLVRSKPIMTVHDSLVWDTPVEEYQRLAEIHVEVFRETPKLCLKYFGFELRVPITGEVEVGDTWGTTTQLDI